MARSGSVDYTVTRNTLIQMAFELIKVGTEGESLDTEDTNVAIRVLNVMIKAMMPYGLMLWKREQVTVPLTASTAAYTIGRSGTPTVTADRPVRLHAAHLVDSSGNRTELTIVSFQEYKNRSNLTSSGAPSEVCFDPTLDNSTLYVWPVPTTADATAYDIYLTVQMPLEDMDGSTDNFDFPQEWEEVLMYMLAVRLAPRYGLSIQERSMLRAEAKEALELVLGFDNEGNSVYFMAEL